MIEKINYYHITFLFDNKTDNYMIKNRLLFIIFEKYCARG